MTEQIVFISEIGAYAIKHDDGHWMGNNEGVCCYRDHYIARGALTIIWQAYGGGAMKFSIQKYDGTGNVFSGEDKITRPIEEVIKDYEESG